MLSVIKNILRFLGLFHVIKNIVYKLGILKKSSLEAIATIKTYLEEEKDKQDLTISHLFRVARSYNQLSMFDESRKIMDRIPKSEWKSGHYNFIASQYLIEGNLEKAKECIAWFESHQNELSKNAFRQLVILKADLQAYEGNAKSAVQLIDDFSKKHKLTVLLELKRLKYMQEYCSFEILNAKYEKLAKKKAFNINVKRDCIKFYRVTNQLEKSLNVLPKNPPSNLNISSNILLEKCRILWLTGQREELVMTLEKVRKLEVIASNMAMFIGNIYDYVDIAKLISNEMIDKIQKDFTEHGFLDIDFAKTCVALKQFELAVKISNRYIETYNYVPVAWVIRGTAKYYLAQFESAEIDLKKAVELSPQMIQGYHYLSLILPRKKNGLIELGQYLERRNQHNARYKYRGQDGRREFYDIDQGQYLRMIGERSKGWESKMERPVCRFLQNQYPKNYTIFNRKDFPKSKMNKLLLIAEDGVGDEIRWAQHYNELKKYYQDIHITCEPRSESIFKRSFPDFTFHSVKRRWPALPASHEFRRKQIPNLDLASVLNEEMYSKLPEFDDVLFANELTFTAWKRESASLNQGAGNGAYLLPDPIMSENMKERLKKVSNGKKIIGLLWRSHLRTPKRSMQHLDIKDFAPLLNLDQYCFVSVQHCMDDYEKEFCNKSGIHYFDDLDLYNNFEDIAALTSPLDLIVGISTLPLEIAASMGTPVWILGTTPVETVFLRLCNSPSDRDLITWNSKVIRVDEERGFETDVDLVIKTLVEKTRINLQNVVNADKFL